MTSKETNPWDHSINFSYGTNYTERNKMHISLRKPKRSQRKEKAT